MSNKKLISQLIAKLKVCDDPIEKDNLEDQILTLVEQDEQDEQYKQGEQDEQNYLNITDKLDEFNRLEELDENEKIRKQRVLIKEAKETRYKTENKLESVDEEQLRIQLMNDALATNEDYAFQKTRKHQGCKNKNKKLTKH